MPHLKIYHLPRACSRVTLTALEQIGCDYEDHVINLMAGEQHSPEYKAINPNGKIPALLVDGELLTENASILLWLNETFPDAQLLPPPKDDLEKARQISDLFWISSGWHPYVRANMMPIRWTTGDPEPVREKGRELLQPLMTRLNATLGQQKWYYGDAWSITDVYFYWCYTTARQGGFPLGDFENVLRHLSDVEAHPSFQAAQAKEIAAINANDALKKATEALQKKA